MEQIGLFGKYGMDALNNEYRDTKENFNFVVIDFRVNKEEKEVELIGRRKDEESGGYKLNSLTVNDITEGERYVHVEGDAEKVK